MIPFLLGFVSLFRPLYRAMGVDFDQLKAIVGVKLVMDNRRNTSAFPSRQKEKESNYKFLTAIFLYSVFGAFVGAAIYTFPTPAVGLTLYFAFLMVTIVMSLISDFSSVLLDTSDNTIILPRPVSGTTIVAARTTHILLYLGQITFGIMLVPVIVVAVKFGGVFSFLFIACTILSVFFSVMFTNGFYLLLMQFTSEEKLKTIINYFQIGMTIVVMGGYQILPRVMGRTLSSFEDFELSWWAAFVPPMWMSGSLELFLSRTPDTLHSVLVLLAAGIPIGGFYLMNKYLAPQFASKLADLGNASADTVEQSEKVSDGKWSLSQYLTLAGVERATYELIGKMLSRDRKLKLKIYPSIGTVFILMVVIVIQSNKGMHFTVSAFRESSGYIFLLYAPFFVIQTALTEIGYSDEFKAAWIYTSAPITQPGLILSGSLKVIFVRFFLPAYIAIAILVLFVWQTKVIDDVIFAFAANFMLALSAASITVKRFPLSTDPAARASVGFLRTLMAGILLMAVGVGHFLLTKIPYVIWIGIPFMLMGTVAVLRSYQKTTWEEIDG